MKSRILGLLAAALLAGPMTAGAGVIFTDSSTKLSGTFALTGSEDFLLGESQIQESYALLPDNARVTVGRP